MSSASPSDDFMRPSSAATDASIIVRLHFAEAMMVLLFNSLDDKQQSSVKDGFGRLLAKVENLEKLGIRARYNTGVPRRAERDAADPSEQSRTGRTRGRPGRRFFQKILPMSSPWCRATVPADSGAVHGVIDSAHDTSVADASCPVAMTSST